MTNKEKDKYLSRLNRKNDIIECKNLQIEKLRTSTTSISIGYGNEVKCSSDADKLGSAIASVIDLQNELREDIAEYVSITQEINEAIKTLKNANLEAIFTYKYICFKSWEEIAKIFGFSDSYIYQLRRKGLERIFIKSW